MNAFDHVVAVVSTGGPLVNGLTPLNSVLGTAFSIGSGVFVTAAHVAKAVMEHEHPQLSAVRRGELYFFPVLDYEVFEAYDAALLQTNMQREVPLAWYLNELGVLTDLFTFGFPYAHDPDSDLISIRGFQGHVVTARSFSALSAHPRIYELSFPCPRGLSGAPVITMVGGYVAGIVIGNHSTQMLIFSEKEQIRESQETIIERYESFQTGVAVQISALSQIESRLLGGSFHDHLLLHNLVAPRTPI